MLFNYNDFKDYYLFINIYKNDKYNFKDFILNHNPISEFLNLKHIDFDFYNNLKTDPNTIFILQPEIINESSLKIIRHCFNDFNNVLLLCDKNHLELKQNLKNYLRYTFHTVGHKNDDYDNCIYVYLKKSIPLVSFQQ